MKRPKFLEESKIRSSCQQLQCHWTNLAVWALAVVPLTGQRTLWEDRADLKASVIYKLSPDGPVPTIPKLLRFSEWIF